MKAEKLAKIISILILLLSFGAVLAAAALVYVSQESSTNETSVAVFSEKETDVKWTPDEPEASSNRDTASDAGVLSSLGVANLTDSEIANLQQYSSPGLGFSMEVPRSISGLDRCRTKAEFPVPVKVFEDAENGIVYITQEYYYDNWDSAAQSNTGSCEKITYDLDKLKKDTASTAETKIVSPKPWLGWALVIKSVKDAQGLDDYIKDAFGSGCFVEGKKKWQEQEGVYEVAIKGDDWDRMAEPGDTKCPLPMSLLAVLYDANKGKVMSVNLGQEPTFFTDSTNSRIYDEKMLKSFRFE